ncbi:MAG: nucleotide-diphosphate-sugar epimerase, partial [Acidobacteria bacterium]|nr:nucleotide-diphosphate-sugar epimerase [Acidobacteriota bacterium]
KQLAGAMARALGREVRYQDVPPDVYRGFGFPGADEMGNMFQFKRDFEAAYVGGRDIGLAKRLNPDLQDFETWLRRNKDRIPIE